MRSELVPAPMLAVRLTVPGHAVSQRLARVKGGDSFVSTWRSVHLGPVTIGIAVGRAGQALDHENRKTPISKPAANAQRPNVQAETTRARLRRSASCGIS